MDFQTAVSSYQKDISEENLEKQVSALAQEMICVGTDSASAKEV